MMMIKVQHEPLYGTNLNEMMCTETRDKFPNETKRISTSGERNSAEAPKISEKKRSFV